MKPIAIIESKVWRDSKNGRTCSIYGVRPYESDSWELVLRGFTVQNDNGTVGNGNKPFATLEEAKAKYPNLPVNI